ncbi:hypothetical protein Q9L58_006998, partial [Maublancomyces gigas]
MTRQELVDRLLIVDDQNHLLRLLNKTSINLLTVLRERGARDGLWERRVLEVGSNGASGAEEEEEEEDEEEGNRAQRITHQFLQALSQELKPWPVTAVIVFYIIISKVIEFLVGLLTNYVFAKII